MGLVSEILSLPLAPVRVAFWTVSQVVDAAEREYYSPAANRGALAELSRQYDGGLISAEEFDVREDELLDRLAEGEQRGRS
jgi:hypothetical protein